MKIKKCGYDGSYLPFCSYRNGKISLHIFVTFLLEVISDVLKDVIDSQSKRQDVGVNVGTNVDTKSQVQWKNIPWRNILLKR